VTWLDVPSKWDAIDTRNASSRLRLIVFLTSGPTD
jgi:hypothetical protein